MNNAQGLFCVGSLKSSIERNEYYFGQKKLEYTHCAAHIIKGTRAKEAIDANFGEKKTFREKPCQ